MMVLSVFELQVVDGLCIVVMNVGVVWMFCCVLVQGDLCEVLLGFWIVVDWLIYFGYFGVIVGCYVNCIVGVCFEFDG